MISSKRINLVKWVYDGPRLKTMVGWLKDPEVVRYSEQRHKYHDEETQLSYLTDGPEVFREIYAEDKFIGTISAYLDKNNSVADVGILIGDKSVWGKGYGAEAWTLFCNHLLTNGIRKIEAGTMSKNLPMLSVFKKYDMYYEGARRNHFALANNTDDMSLWGKFA